MRILFLGNNWVAWQILTWLRNRGEKIVGLVVHPAEHRKYGTEIIQAAGVDASFIFDGSRLHEAELVQKIKTLQPDIGISALFGYILRREVLDVFPSGCINVHPAFLPYNRGAYPNVWSIVEGTPAGATIHYVDEGVDTGDIVGQQGLIIEPVDTGATLYEKLCHLCFELFKQTWPLIQNGQILRKPQAEASTCHRARDVMQIDEIDLDRSYTARNLINILRARTFPPYPGAFFMHGNRKVYLRLQLYFNDSSAVSSENEEQPGSTKEATL